MSGVFHRPGCGIDDTAALRTRRLLLPTTLFLATALGCRGPASSTPPASVGPVASTSLARTATRLPTQPVPIQYPTPTDQSALDALPAGQHLVVVRIEEGDAPGEGPTPSLFVISTQGEQLGRLARGLTADASLSPDGLHIAYWIRAVTPTNRLAILALRDNSLSRVPGTFENASNYVWSPDGNAVLMTQGGNIELVTVETGERSVILDCIGQYQDGECGVIGWSPDGKWIAYYVDDVRSGALPQWSGIYMISADCIARGDCSADEADGPILPISGAATWSPDGRFLAAGIAHSILVFDTQTQAVTMELAVTGEGGSQSLAWSPDGRFIAYTTDSDIWLASPLDRTISRISHATRGSEPIVFWLVVPPAR